jgi:hypothetical protein
MTKSSVMEAIDNWLIKADGERDAESKIPIEERRK